MDDFRSERNYQEALDRISILEWAIGAKDKQLLEFSDEIDKRGVAVATLVDALTVIKGHLDPDDPTNYRADDPEGAMDTAFERARQALVDKL